MLKSHTGFFDGIKRVVRRLARFGPPSKEGRVFSYTLKDDLGSISKGTAFSEGETPEEACDNLVRRFAKEGFGVTKVILIPTNGRNEVRRPMEIKPEALRPMPNIVWTNAEPKN